MGFLTTPCHQINFFMHDIEPYHLWRDDYDSAEDKNSPFYGRTYDEFYYSQAIYNYFIHPQWDGFGSHTLYMKILFADYDVGFAIFEMLGEWIVCLTNDVMYLKRDVADELIACGIYKFIIICGNVLNFHSSDDCYYEEWSQDVSDSGGWVCLLNLYQHGEEEWVDTGIELFDRCGGACNAVNRRTMMAPGLMQKVEKNIGAISKRIK